VPISRPTLLTRVRTGDAVPGGSMAKCGRWGWSAMVSADRLAL
jgi:hypothetical protein